MFQTFTGKSRRPRNVNLSGQAGNPFSNTSWSLSDASNATQTISNAQADREKRQAERRRLKAVGQIQRTWRGHRVRRELGESRRDLFDGLYRPNNSGQGTTKRLSFAFNLLLAFFNLRRNDDFQRLMLFVRDCETVEPAQLPPSEAHPSRMTRFVQILVEALNRAASEAFVYPRKGSRDELRECLDLIKLTTRIICAFPNTLTGSVDIYYTALAQICRQKDLDQESSLLLMEALLTPLRIAFTPDMESKFYDALAFRFLTQSNLYLFEDNSALLSKSIDLSKLASTMLDGYSGLQGISNDQLLWLLAHFIDLGNATSTLLSYLEALHMQISALSPEISTRLQNLPDQSLNGVDGGVNVDSLEPYVSRQLLSLVSRDGIPRLLRDLSEAVTRFSTEGRQATSLLAGYTLTLLLCFPSQADDIRMQLFLATVPSPEGEVPTTKFLWKDMRQSSLFQKLVTESEAPVDVLRNYVCGTFKPSTSPEEEREWRVALMFLELYVFVLRLSDDEDFFSGINPPPLESDASTSRIRSCSLPLEDLKVLTTFLKNTAFALHYRSHAISSGNTDQGMPALFRFGSRVDSGAQNRPKSRRTDPTKSAAAQVLSTRLDLDSLKELMTTAMKMLYERDSRKQFLPSGHWLMTDKLEREDFVSAVIAEDERQRQEDARDGDTESDDEVEDRSPDTFAGLRAPAGFNRANSYARIERMRLNQKKAQRERRLAEMGPKLEILKHMPFVVPFHTRVRIFRQFISLDREQRLSERVHPPELGDPFPLPTITRHNADIRRGMLLEDAFQNFYEIGEGLKDPISITFVDQFGTPEPGIDGGGVTKEFLTSVTTEAFGRRQDDELPFFTSSEKGLLYPDPTSIDRCRVMLRDSGLSEEKAEWKNAMQNLLKRYEFMGRIVGKCLYEGILVDLVFAGFFLLQWPSTGSGSGSTYKGSVNDLRDLDEELYKGMLRLKNYPGDVSELGIDFTISDQISFPNQPLKTVTRNLVPNGDKVLVTNDNRPLYISYVARHRLMHQPALQTAAFLRGLRMIIRPSWLSMFNQSELQRLVGGDSSEIDIEDLRRNTVYSGVYQIGDDLQEHPTIELFWKVMRGFTDEQRRDVLKYVSSTPRAPLLGFSQLRPKFSIRDAGQDETRLPSTSTCVNLLKLPQYKSGSVMRDKLLYAVTSGAGFDLS